MKCEACQKTNCQNCRFCIDKNLKQACEIRKCTNRQAAKVKSREPTTQLRRNKRKINNELILPGKVSAKRTKDDKQTLNVQNLVCECKFTDTHCQGRIYIAEKKKSELRKCFPAITRSCSDATMHANINVQNYIFVKSDGDCPYVAKVQGFFESTDEQGNRKMMASIL